MREESQGVNDVGGWRAEEEDKDRGERGRKGEMGRIKVGRRGSRANLRWVNRETGLMAEPSAGSLELGVVGGCINKWGDSNKYSMTGNQHSYPCPPRTLLAKGVTGHVVSHSGWVMSSWWGSACEETLEKKVRAGEDDLTCAVRCKRWGIEGSSCGIRRSAGEEMYWFSHQVTVMEPIRVQCIWAASRAKRANLVPVAPFQITSFMNVM